MESLKVKKSKRKKIIQKEFRLFDGNLNNFNVNMYYEDLSADSTASLNNSLKKLQGLFATEKIEIYYKSPNSV